MNVITQKQIVLIVMMWLPIGNLVEIPVLVSLIIEIRQTKRFVNFATIHGL